ncbi:hypothetical protein LCGC14_0359680 [marine sediment metagenome]|uniref:Uncharacterized protein n=1 Tax=marine sediment metagenome TaxID=412755 RepID=A0A0F9WGQ2_9ZZZZ|nr:hypothetical protein [Candidatus Aminicenantes bacterium]
MILQSRFDTINKRGCRPEHRERNFIGILGAILGALGGATIPSAVTFGTIALGAGIGLAAGSQIDAGIARSNMADLNALNAKRNAELTISKISLQKDITDLTLKQHKDKTQKQLRKIELAQNVSGADPSSPSFLITAENFAADAQIDAYAIQAAGSAEEAALVAERAGFEQEAVIQGMKRKSARTSGFAGAGATLLTGVGKFADAT